MKTILTTWTAIFVLVTAGQGQETLKQRELCINLGSGLGDFDSTFAWGLCLNLPVTETLRIEPEFFYYYNPSPRSYTPGLAITSTGLSYGLSYLIHWELVRSRILLDAGFSLGVLHVSETWEVDRLKQFTSRISSETYVGPAAAIQFRLDGRSGVRFDARYLYIAWDGRRIPRLSIGYILWY